MQLSKVLNPYPNSSAYLSPKSDQYFSNVALKVNTKLGGINHQVRAMSNPQCLVMA